MEEYLDLTTNEETLKRRVVYVNVFDVNFFNRLFMGLNLGKGRFHVGELPVQRERERGNGTLHTLKDVDPKEMDEALFAVELAEKAFSAANAGAVLRVV